MKIFKFIGALILSMLVLGGVLLFTLGSGLFMAGKAIQEEANKPVTQAVTNIDGVTITVPLIEKYVLRYDGVSLCTPEDKKKDHFFDRINSNASGTSYSCTGNNCEVDLSLDNKDVLPTEIKMYVNKNGSCIQEDFLPSTGRVVIDNYEMKIEMTEELLTLLNISKTNYKAMAKNTRNYSSWEFGGTKKISASYDERKVGDILLIDDKEVAKIVYQ